MLGFFITIAVALVVLGVATLMQRPASQDARTNARPSADAACARWNDAKDAVSAFQNITPGASLAVTRHRVEEAVTSMAVDAKHAAQLDGADFTKLADTAREIYVDEQGGNVSATTQAFGLQMSDLCANGGQPTP